MREIKFRVWDKENNGETFSKDDGWFDYELCDDEFELMQYVGLKDKNGVEIYEEDIVKFDPSVPPLGVMPQEDEVGIIKYILNSFLVVTKNNVNYDIDELGDWVVIGNIYENKELLNENA
ncbi:MULTISPECIES: YopX family protein [unclassified Campylobacter]|uniref:YopX family protein n=1 Tax=unclassified Campylobacter TaxID=2593542 RepID=UPI003D34EA50